VTNSLQSSLVQSARNLASTALGNCNDCIIEDDEKASKPEFKGTVVAYNGRTITYNDDHVSLATTDKRVTAEYVTPVNDAGTPFEDYWTNEWEKDEATLHKRDEYERRRDNLQQTGTRSAHLTIKSIGSRFARWSADYLHRVSKALVREAVENDCTPIGFKNLEHIRERISNASKFQQWAFRELQRHVEYKAEEHGIDVDDVTPTYTSQRCSHGECGFTHEGNRDGDEFECLKCGKQLHSDYTAARNVGWRLVQHWLKSGTERATSQLALKSGTVNANCRFRPTALRS
jgi:IS605 OrfB family transposase